MGQETQFPAVGNSSDAAVTPWVASVAVVWRLSRWRGLGTLREPPLLVVHVGMPIPDLPALAPKRGGWVQAAA